MGGRAFSNNKHLRTLSEEWRDGKKEQDAAYKFKIKGLLSDLKRTDKRLLLYSRIIRDWLSVHVTTVSRTVLYATEFQFFCTHYNVSPVNLQSRCNGCGTSFGLTHILSCRICVLVLACHNKIHDELLYLYRRAFTSESICAETLIHHGRTRSEQEIRHSSDKDKETRGDVIIQGLWYHQVDAITDIKLGDANADTYE